MVLQHNDTDPAVKAFGTRIKIGEVLGEGTAGRVYDAKLDGERVALKTLLVRNNRLGLEGDRIPDRPKHRVGYTRLNWGDTIRIEHAHLWSFHEINQKKKDWLPQPVKLWILADPDENPSQQKFVLDPGQNELDLPFLVLERLHIEGPRGGGLARLMGSEAGPPCPGSLPLWEVLEVGRQYLDFLGKLHKLGMDYSDIKCEHLVWVWDDAATIGNGRLRVLDFNGCTPPQAYPFDAVAPTPQARVQNDVHRWAHDVLFRLLTGDAWAGVDTPGPKKPPFGNCLPRCEAAPQFGDDRHLPASVTKLFARICAHGFKDAEDVAGELGRCLDGVVKELGADLSPLQETVVQWRSRNVPGQPYEEPKATWKRVAKKDSPSNPTANAELQRMSLVTDKCRARAARNQAEGRAGDPGGAGLPAPARSTGGPGPRNQ